MTEPQKAAYAKHQVKPAVEDMERAEAALSEAIGKVWDAVRAIEPDPYDGSDHALRAHGVSLDVKHLVTLLSQGRRAVEGLRHALLADDSS